MFRRSLLIIAKPPVQTELAINTHTMVADMHRNALTSQRVDDSVRAKFLYITLRLIVSQSPRFSLGQLS